jgi:hypothetical protein
VIDFKAGRLPHDPQPERLLLSTYQAAKPTPPPSADWASGIRSWPMLLNSELGDCTAAGAGHIAQQVNWYGRDTVAPVTDEQTLTMYEAVSGYRPGEPSTDVGATLQDALNYWRTTGVGGNTIAAFAQVKATDLATVRACIAAFGSVYCGMWVPQSAMDQIDAGKPWTKTGRSANLGGHCVPIMAYDQDSFTCVTWGQTQRMDVGFFQAQFDEVWCPLDLDWLRVNGSSPAGLNTEALNADFQQLTGKPGPFPHLPPDVINPDVQLASVLHQWLLHPSNQYRPVRQAAQAWLDARHL